MARARGNRPTMGLVLIRMCVGAILAAHGWSSLHGGGVDGALVQDTVRASLDHAPGPMAWWGETALLANPAAIAFLWRWVALICGICLVLGALTRPAGCLAALFALHGVVFGAEELRLTFLLIAISCLAFAISRAGRRLGFDTAFDDHFSPWVTWTRGRRPVFP